MQLGTDIMELDRIQQALTRQPNFAQKVLSEQEFQQYNTLTGFRQIEFLAGRFCAKEAYVKALGTGFRQGITMTSISCLPNQFGQPEIVQGPWLSGVTISISHSKTVAMATCIISASQAEIHEHLMKEGLIR